MSNQLLRAAVGRFGLVGGRGFLLSLLFSLLSFPVVAQEIHGTIRSKYEYQTEEGEGRFQVRSARVSFSGALEDLAEYKAEIDFSDEGTIKMLDAYARFHPFTRQANFTIGQMRVPFTIDAHRSPHQQYFANRSFIAKQVGNVRDVGATVGYTFGRDVQQTQVILEAGLFNGSGLTNQKDYWTKSVNFSAKGQLFLPVSSLQGGSGNTFRGLNVTLSVQKTRPDVTVMMYDAGIYFQTARFHLEAEYLLKTYGHDSFDDVHALNAFACYDIPLRRCAFQKISPLVRFDYMTDHSDGEYDDDGVLPIDDYERSRLTAGATLSLLKPFKADIRLNFEKYFYPDASIPATSEKDKIVCEFMLRF